MDVTTLKELAARWKPEAKMIREGESAHLALLDIKDSIDELKHYRKTFIKI
ncbi:3'-to-5' oligoribonuclease (orn) [uncultured Gammaproteobacteria bacterium]|nr:3'-to-5' oligoribonuclease (orn) [uncultured Gammaproteobacteria bacterium]